MRQMFALPFQFVFKQFYDVAANDHIISSKLAPLGDRHRCDFRNLVKIGTGRGFSFIYIDAFAFVKFGNK